MGENTSNRNQCGIFSSCVGINFIKLKSDKIFPHSMCAYKCVCLCLAFTARLPWVSPIEYEGDSLYK